MKTSRQFPAGALTCLALMLANPPCAAADDARTMFDEQTYRSLVAERKASRVGDLLTVVVQESSSATSTVDLRSQRNFTVSGEGESSKFGTISAAASTSSGSDGNGSTQRSGRLLAQLSVRVTEVTPSGDLMVSGHQSLQINGEEQLITLTGLVRTRDISENNTVLSSRIAEANIKFDGEGFVTDQSRPGWLAKLFNFLGL